MGLGGSPLTGRRHGRGIGHAMTRASLPTGCGSRRSASVGRGGQLGLGVFAIALRPGETLLPESAVVVSTGDRPARAPLVRGAVICWGDNASGPAGTLLVVIVFPNGAGRAGA